MGKKAPALQNQIFPLEKEEKVGKVHRIQTIAQKRK